MTQSASRNSASLDGILLLDKPQGLSSNQALQRVRHLFRARKGRAYRQPGSARHRPAADVLRRSDQDRRRPARRAQGLRHGRAAGHHHRHRRCRGPATARTPVPASTLRMIDAALRRCTGRIQQTSADLFRAQARRRAAVRQGAARRDRGGRSARTRSTLSNCNRLLDLLDGGEPLLRLHVECGSGTYVRSLVRDLGELLGCGAHVAELRRLWVDPFREPRMWTLEALQALAAARASAAWSLPAAGGGRPDRPRRSRPGPDAGRRSAAARARRRAGASRPAGTVRASTARRAACLGLGQLDEGVAAPRSACSTGRRAEPGNGSRRPAALKPCFASASAATIPRPFRIRHTSLDSYPHSVHGERGAHSAAVLGSAFLQATHLKR